MVWILLVVWVTTFGALVGLSVYAARIIGQNQLGAERRARRSEEYAAQLAEKLVSVGQRPPHVVDTSGVVQAIGEALGRVLSPAATGDINDPTSPAHKKWMMDLEAGLQRESGEGGGQPPYPDVEFDDWMDPTMRDLPTDGAVTAQHQDAEVAASNGNGPHGPHGPHFSGAIFDQQRQRADGQKFSSGSSGTPPTGGIEK